MLKKIIGLVFLFCFAFSLDGEARQSSTCHPSAASKKIKRPTTRKKRDATVIRKKRPHRVATGRKRTQRVSRTRNRSQRVSRVRTRSQRASRVRARPQLKRRRSCQPVSIQLPPPTYLSKLKPQTQRNAQLGGFNRLYNKNLYGQGIAAVIEYSGGWHEIHSIKQGGGGLSPEIRENYRRNFLTPTGDPQGRFHPDVRASWVNSKFPHHASEVASVILDLAPHAQVQPVTMFHGLEDCDLATAVTRLCSPEWNHVGVINISAGIIAGRTKRKTEQNPDGTLRELSKIVNAPRVTEAFKAAARAGKIVVLAVDNKGENIQLPEYRPSGSASINCFVGRILNKLKKDPLTRQSVIFAGALDLNTNTIAAYSNRPGNLPEAQDSFLCASGDYEFAYKPEAAAGTSLAAPAITAALLDLLSIPGVTPQRAAKALLETADKGLDTTLYGRGRMNAARAAEWLEAGNY